MSSFQKTLLLMQKQWGVIYIYIYIYIYDKCGEKEVERETDYLRPLAGLLIDEARLFDLGVEEFL